MTSREDEFVRRARSGIDTDEELSAIFGEPVRRTKVRSYGPHDVSEEQVARAATPVPAEESEEPTEEPEPAEEPEETSDGDAEPEEPQTEPQAETEEPHEDYEVSEEELAEMDQEFDDFDDPTDDGIPYGANNYDEYYEVEVAAAPDEVDDEEEEYDEPAYYPEEKEEKEDEAFDSFTKASEPELVTHSDFTFDAAKVKGKGVAAEENSRPKLPSSVVKALRGHLETVVKQDTNKVVTDSLLITGYLVAMLNIDRDGLEEHVRHIADAFLAADSLSSRLFTVVDRQSATISSMERSLTKLDGRSKTQMSYLHELELGLAYLLATSTGEVSMMDVTPKNMRITRDETKQALNRLRIEGRDAKK